MKFEEYKVSPILTRNIAINGEFPFKTQWQDLDRGELTGEATWEEPTEGLDLVFLGEKSWSFWCFAERFPCFVSVLSGCFMCIGVFCQYEDTHVTPLLSRTFETSLPYWKWPFGGYIHGINMY